MGTDLLLEGVLIFSVVAALQIPGKSNFGVVSLATRHPHRDVFLGASVGLTAATVVSVTIGYGAETVLSPYLSWVKLAGGVILIGFGLREILTGPGAVHEPGEGTPAEAHTASQVRTVALGLVFLLEMGDNTQILAILFVASTGNLLLVFVATTAALITIAALSSAGAGYLKQHVPEAQLRTVMGVGLIVVGALTILLTLLPSLVPAAL